MALGGCLPDPGSGVPLMFRLCSAACHAGGYVALQLRTALQNLDWSNGRVLLPYAAVVLGVELRYVWRHLRSQSTWKHAIRELVSLSFLCAIGAGECH